MTAFAVDVVAVGHEDRADRRLANLGQDVAVRLEAGALGAELGAALLEPRLPRSSSRATTAQERRETTCARSFARRPSSSVG